MDITTGTVPVYAFIIVLLYVGRLHVKRLDNHLITCDRRAIKVARTMQWMGDCTYAIASKVGASLPPRPERDEEERE